MVLFWVCFFGALCYIAYCWGKKIAEWQSNNRSPEISERMQIIEKRKVCDDDGADYSMICMTEAGEKITFHIPKKVFRDVTEDEYLAVTHKGTRFLAYKKDTLMLND